MQKQRLDRQSHKALFNSPRPHQEASAALPALLLLAAPCPAPSSLNSCVLGVSLPKEQEALHRAASPRNKPNFYRPLPGIPANNTGACQYHVCSSASPTQGRFTCNVGHWPPTMYSKATALSSFQIYSKWKLE